MYLISAYVYIDGLWCRKVREYEDSVALEDAVVLFQEDMKAIGGERLGYVFKEEMKNACRF